MRKLGYFTEWSVYRENAKSIQELVVDGGYTDIIYAFAIFDKLGQLNFGDPHAAIDKQILQNLQALKELSKLSRIGISVGGWNNRDDFRKLNCYQLVSAICQFVSQHGFDFVDIDWEFDSPEEAQKYEGKFKELLADLRAHLPKNADLMVSLQCNVDTIRVLGLSEIEPNVSLFNVMGYDLSGSWSLVADHYAPLLAVSRVIDALSKYVPVGKIGVGVSGFGARFKGCKGIGCEYKSFDLVTSKDLISIQMGWCEDTRSSVYQCDDVTFVSIESKESLACKLEFVNDRCLAGLCVWDIEAFSHIKWHIR